MNTADGHTDFWHRLIREVPAAASGEALTYWAGIRQQWMVTISAPEHQLEDAPLKYKNALKQHEVVTEIYDALTAEAARYTEQSLYEGGCGRPPVPYTLIYVGSGGRKEMTPWSDQDHGLIWEDGYEISSDAIEQYFTIWGLEFTKAMEALGFPPCTGKVLSSEPAWRGSISQWMERARYWTDDRSWESMRTFTMALDMRAVYGELELESIWRQGLEFIQAKQHDIVTKAIVGNLMHRKPSHNSFGQLIRERYGEDAGSFDIKYRLYVPIAQMTRATAWMYGIQEKALSTEERMIQLLIADIPEELYEIIRVIKEHWNGVLTARWLSGGVYDGMFCHSNGMVKPEMLSDSIKYSLKQASQMSIRWMRWLDRRYGNDGRRG